MSRFSIENLTELDKHLAEHTYVSGCDLPSDEDSRIFLAFNDKVPSKIEHPNVYFWYQALRIFNPVVIKSWGAKVDNSSTIDLINTPAPSADKKDEDIDLFGDDDDDDRFGCGVICYYRGQVKKKKVVTKAIVIFDVKIFEQDQDLDALARKIFAIEMEGLVWRTEYKKLPVAYGMNKLQIGCTIEDETVATDDIFDPILEWEDEVQSVDIVSFQNA